jgi:tetratricopeptide (TPR) repeat protein
MKLIFMFLFMASITSPNLSGQESIPQDLSRISALEQQGRFTEVIELASRLIKLSALNQGELGRACLLLGVANEQLGDFAQAQNAYEKALHILSANKEFAENYAATLDNFARLYLEMGRLETAITMEKKVLAEFEKLEDHAAIARSYATLSDLEINQNHRRKGKEYLSRALREARLTNTLDRDFFATVASTQAWLAQLNGDTNTAISEYTRAVALWEAEHGEQHMLTGWGYMLLGKSYAQADHMGVALQVMSKGLNILNQTVGANNPKYLAAQIAYSQVLDESGAHAEAALLKDTAQKAFASLSQNVCMDCRISVAAFH